MIKKLQASEYLRRYDNMTADERASYRERTARWLLNAGRALMAKTWNLDARLKNVITVSEGWNDAECAAFEEGARLLSALVGTHETWLPDLLYAKAAARCIKRMFDMLSSEMGGELDSAEEKAIPSKEYIDKMKKDFPPAAFRNQLMAVPGMKVVDGHRREGDGSSPVADNAGVSVSMPVRPKHIDQYVHLLPKETQERAGSVQDLLRELDNAREKARLLMGSPQASPADRAAWAKKATQTDSKLRSIYDELDREWDKLARSGRVVVDVLGNVNVLAPDGETAVRTGEEGKPELTSEQKARRRELRKWLIDTRRGNGNARESRVKQWHENFKEYLTLEGNAAFEDEKIIVAAKHYGIELPSRDDNE